MRQGDLFRPPAPAPPPSPEELERARLLAIEEGRRLAAQIETRPEHRLKDPPRNVAPPPPIADTLDELLPPDREPPDLGPESVITIRELAGLSREKLGALLGINEGAVTRIEKGTRALSNLDVEVLDMLREVLLAIPNDATRHAWASAIVEKPPLRAVVELCAAGAELGVSRRRGSARKKASTLLEMRVPAPELMEALKGALGASDDALIGDSCEVVVEGDASGLEPAEPVGQETT